MTRINLKDYYPHYKDDLYIEVPEELAELLQFYDARESTYERKLRYHKSYFSLDRNDGIEREIRYVSLSPEEIYERKVTREQLHAAMAELTDKQAKRIYAHFFLGLTKAQIARTEGVGRDVIGESIERGLVKIEKYLKSMDM